jgi:hypothetical protein
MIYWLHFSVKHVSGSPLMKIPGFSAAPYNTNTTTPRTGHQTQTAHLNATLRSIYNLCETPLPETQSEPWERRRFTHYRRPLLKAHGITSPGNCHTPRLFSFASFCNRISRNSRGQNCLYQKASPSDIRTSSTGKPSPVTTLHTCRPYLSLSTNRNFTPGAFSNCVSRSFAALNPICPCSGASRPHTRTRIRSPRAPLKSIVSPSYTLNTNQ